MGSQLYRTTHTHTHTHRALTRMQRDCGFEGWWRDGVGSIRSSSRLVVHTGGGTAAESNGKGGGGDCL